MKITKEEVGFQTEVNIGKFAYIIHMPEDDSERCVDVDINNLLTKAINFPRVILKGEPFRQKEEVSNFFKKVLKKNINVKFEIETFGKIKPTGMGSVEVDYVVSIPLNGDLSFKDRVNMNAIEWFVEAGATFKFYIKDDGDIDKLEMLINNASIPRRLVCVIPASLPYKITEENKRERLNYLIKISKYYGFNWSPNGEEFDLNEN